jgi:hypothetical protein
MSHQSPTKKARKTTIRRCDCDGRRGDGAALARRSPRSVFVAPVNAIDVSSDASATLNSWGDSQVHGG